MNVPDPNGCWVAGCCSRLSVCRRGLEVLVESPRHVLDLDGCTHSVRRRIREPSVSRESRFQKAGQATYTINSPVQTTWMGFGWAERRVVRGPQGPPCSSASASMAPCICIPPILPPPMLPYYCSLKSLNPIPRQSRAC